MNVIDANGLSSPPRTFDAPRAATTVAPRAPVIALVGRPNVGKSTFFATASGRYAETANVPGTTVGVTRRALTIGGTPSVLVDLPGTFSLADASDGLPPFWQLLAGERPDALLVIVDAGDVGRHLPLVLACRDLGLPLVVAANLADEAAARGVALDTGRLSQLLAAPVHVTVGREGRGVLDALADAARLAGERRNGRRRVAPATPYGTRLVRRVLERARELEQLPAASPDALADAMASGALSTTAAATVLETAALDAERWAVADRWAAQVERRHAVPPRLAERIARAATAPWPGLAIFAAAVLATLGFTMAAGTILSSVLATTWGAAVSPWLTSTLTAAIPSPTLAHATLWAVDSGLLAMLSVGIPFVLTFYLALAVLEDSGYLAATAVLTDRLFNAVGLSGRAAIPILAATGCNVPAIYGTRVLASRRERLLASFLIVLTPCSARSAVVIAALAPFAGFGVALGAFGVVAAIAVAAGIGANLLVPGRQSPLILELPPIRRPVVRLVAAKAWARFGSFVRTATPVMLAGSFVLGLAYESGAIGPIQDVIGPALGWLLGLPAVAGIALVLGFLRKELALQLLIVLAVAQLGAGAASLGAFMGPGQLFVYAVVTAVSIPCVATLATMVGEFGWRAAVLQTAAVLLVALGAGAIVARIVGVA